MRPRSEEEVEQDIGTFLARHESMTMSDRRELLRAMFKKHILINEGELILSKYDFDMILGTAKNAFSRERIPQKIGDKDFYSAEAAQLFLIEAVFSVLNSKDALKKLPKFDRR